MFTIFTKTIIHLLYTHPHPSQIFRKHSLQFLLGVTVVLRESEGNGYAKFIGINMENSELQ